MPADSHNVLVALEVGIKTAHGEIQTNDLQVKYASKLPTQPGDGMQMNVQGQVLCPRIPPFPFLSTCAALVPAAGTIYIQGGAKTANRGMVAIRQ